MDCGVDQLYLTLRGLGDAAVMDRVCKRQRTDRVCARPVRRRKTSLVNRLFDREENAVDRATTLSNYVHKAYGGYHPAAKLDAHDATANDVKLCFLKRRSKVVEIVAAKDMIFGLTQTGICTAFAHGTHKRICFLNIAPDEVIRSLFYNKLNESLITVSVYREDNYSSLKCRSTPLEYIRRNQPEAGIPLFETESLRWPGFVEFDDVNSKVLTFSARDNIYKIWDLVNYTLLYSIDDNDIKEIKISPGIMLLIYNRTLCGSAVPLKILSIDNGETLKSFEHPMEPEKKVDFIEQFNEKLLIKQEGRNLQIFDVQTCECIEVSSDDFVIPSAFIFLYENQLFLTFLDHQVAVWNFRGELVTRFEDHQLWHPDCNTNNIYITSRQDQIISYCRSGATSESDTGDQPVCGSIHVSDILTGKCVARIQVSDDPNKRVRFQEALSNVTALFYTESTGEVLSGTSDGIIHVWKK